MKRVFSCAAFVLVTTNVVATEPCLDNFSVEGNILTGRTYKTWAFVPGMRQQDAFPRVYAFTAENGFTVLTASKEAGAISAAQSVSYGKGKTAPLNVTLKEEGAGTRIAINYATSGGLVSPEDAIKRHFCLTIAAASDATTGASAAATAQAGTTPPAQRSVPKGFAMTTAEQQKAIEREIPKSLPNERVRRLVTEASPSIAAFIERIACLVDYTGASALNEFAAPGANLGNMYVGLRPMRTAQYHNKAACMTVFRVHGWNAPANNALRFEVIYKADDSGETSKLTHEAIKQPDGAWLFSQ